MYLCYMDGILMPVAPSKINTKIKNKNRTITLINEGEANILKSAGLQEISFNMMIPAYKYPFALYLGGIFLPISYYLEILDRLKNSKKPFQLIIIREGVLGALGFDTNLKVSLEDYQILEDAGNGRDITVSIKLKQYQEKTKTVVRVATAVGGGTVKYILEKVRDSSKKIEKTYKVKEGDTLYTIAKKQLGNGEKYRDLITLNKLGNSSDIEVGQVIRLE
ncbi:MAG: LysM peptidoglycan-binding domain-containing protein [Fusobacterium sp.]|nr:LysM peptidoglycan-binding domain-containing protein [Fusobacterium sp.]